MKCTIAFSLVEKKYIAGGICIDVECGEKPTIKSTVRPRVFPYQRRDVSLANSWNGTVNSSERERERWGETNVALRRG